MLSISCFSNRGGRKTVITVPSKTPSSKCVSESECVRIPHDPGGLSGNFKNILPKLCDPLPWRGEVYLHPLLLSLGRFVTALTNRA